ncbi:hypothetical protein E4U42_002804 [Claviceps africana]|uniref:Uncharacterized protein n=1 Tax=Claviceps africana TaxID=83212 RepID=A0A8K0NH94_9HYPO|nr:hypothetical protein E4U42_002804 [Claviceps africana]
MARHLSLHNRLWSLESAAKDETNLLLSFRYQNEAEHFRRRLWNHRNLIQATVRHHLRLRKDDICLILPPESWLQGGFNVCVVIEVESDRFTGRLIFRCPMPHKLAEQQYPGTIDEKLNCEVATYIWMQEHCADIRIPSLYAFGFISAGHSNIFVDDNWNVTCLIDLEWISALPREMLSVPYWLTNCSIDGIIDDEYVTFDEVRKTFLKIMDLESKKMQMEHDVNITDTMRDTWESKGVWFWACVRSINAWLFVFEDHILPKFSADQELIVDLKQVSTFWHHNIDHVVKAKVDDEERYQAELRSLFEGNN